MKLLVTDIDGSLLPFGKPEFSPALAEFFRALPAHGVQATFASGKPFERALPLAKALGITIPLICANGALIKDPITLETLFCEPIAADIAQDVIQLLAHESRCQLFPEIGDKLYFVENPAIPEASWRYQRPGWTKPAAYNPTQDFLTATGGLPHKIAVSTLPQDQVEIEARLQAGFGDKLNIFHPKPDMIDLTPKHVDKGTATKFLAQKLGITHNDIIALGDEMNDLSLFAEAGYRLARDHAPDAVLQKADQIVGPTEVDLINALKKVLNIA